MEIVKDFLEDDYEKGDLCLGIFCHKCGAQLDGNDGCVCLEGVLNETKPNIMRCLWQRNKRQSFYKS
jgi:hypothetical protein